jgi:hypothetical protein
MAEDKVIDLSNSFQVQSGWICPECNTWIAIGIEHNCQFFSATLEEIEDDLQERQVIALERIANVPVEKQRSHTQMELLKDIYNSEINISIDWFWDGGIHIVLGDEANGILEEVGELDIDKCEAWLKHVIFKHYPSSDFTKKYKT